MICTVAGAAEDCLQTLSSSSTGAYIETVPKYLQELCVSVTITASRRHLHSAARGDLHVLATITVISRLADCSGVASNFSFGGYIPDGLGTEVPSEVQGPSLQTLFADFDCRNDQHLKISHNSPPDS